MKGKYHVLELAYRRNHPEVLPTNGQMLLPVVDLITEARLAVDEVIDRAGRGLTILSMSAEQIAGPKSPGKASGEVRWHGRQLGRVKLSQLPAPEGRRGRSGAGLRSAAEKREDGRGDVRGTVERGFDAELPRGDPGDGQQRWGVELMSREAAEQGARRLEELLARRWEEVLVIYLDGMRFGSHHISAVGVDSEGRKHVLGIQLGATENAAAVKDLLTRLRQQGLRTDQRYLFVIDGAKALRAGIEEVGSNQLVQRPYS